MHDHSTRIYRPHWFISFICKTTIRQKNMVLFHLIFLLYPTIRPKISVLIDLLLLCTHDHSIEIYGPFSFVLSFVHDHSTKTYGPQWCISFICSRPFEKNIWSSFISSFFSARPFDQKLGSTLIYFFYLCTTIRPKIRVLINLFISFLHDHSTKVRGHSYSLIYTFPNCANISFALFLTVLPLHFVRYIQSSFSYPYISYTIFSL